MQTERRLDQLPVAIIGAGPIGLTAAAHLSVRGEEFLVLEKGPGPGTFVGEWDHVRMFSPWRYNVDSVAAGLLRAHGWPEPDPDAFPTGGELRDRLLKPLAALPALAERVHYGVEVVGVSRVGLDRLKTEGRGARPFRLRVRDTNTGEERNVVARAVVDASGTWGTPKPLGADGLPAIGERRAAGSVHYGMPDLAREASRYGGRRVAVVGGGDSSFNALVDLSRFAESRPGTELHWVVRGSRPAFGGGEADQLPERGALGEAVRRLVSRGALVVHTGFRIAEVASRASGVELLSDDGERIEVDEIVCVTGFRPNLEMLREIRLDLDLGTEAPAALGPLIDPNVHSCGTVRPHGYRELTQPDEGFYVVGMKSYGRAPTFLLLTGYEQVRSVVAALAGDLEEAAAERLVLPETGVCSSDALMPNVQAGAGERVEAEATPSCCGSDRG